MLRQLRKVCPVISRRLQHGINQPSGSTGIEHALKTKEVGQKHKQDFKDYKCSEYLHFNKYSFYDTEAYAKYVSDKFDATNELLKAAILRSIRVLLRDINNVDNLITTSVAEIIVEAAALNEPSRNVEHFDVVMEACRCLVNGLKQSPNLLQHFIQNDYIYVTHLAERLITTSLQIFNPNVEQPIFSDFTPIRVLELLFLDLRIMFAVTAKGAQHAPVGQHLNLFAGIIHRFAAQITSDPQDADVAAARLRLSCITEALKIMFNAFYGPHNHDAEVIKRIARECANLICGTNIPSAMKQDSVNVLSMITGYIDHLCQPIEQAEGANVLEYQGYNVAFVQALLNHFEERLDDGANHEPELLTTHLSVLFHLCRGNKVARRFCREKILPPLRAADVERPPEQGNSLRNKIIRLMNRTTGSVKVVAAEFLFLLCKRSVPRMVKYCGYGNAAGLLADHGCLGKLDEGRRASDSEDSETADYKQVESQINPVTGYIPVEVPNPLEGMTQEQKEHEAMKLANTMNKLLDAGVFMPGRIGADGKPQAVAHVSELVSDVHVDSEHSDSN